MNIAIVTWTTYNNYGTLLQEYALQAKINELGHSSIILSDDLILKRFRQSNPYKVKAKNTKVVNRPSFKRNIVVKVLDLLMNPYKLYASLAYRFFPDLYEWPYQSSRDRCKEFTLRKLDLYKKVDPDNLQDLNEKFDLFVAGSDQIWSVFDINFNSYYYLDFVQKPKISYAPSLGTDDITSERASQLSHLLREYRAISVREQSSSNLLSAITGRRVEWVVDPVLLYDARFWTAFINDTHIVKRKYILCYFLENKDWYFRYAEAVSRRLGLRLILIPNRWEFLNTKYIIRYPIGPVEFVSLIKNASFVITDSYHGSLFSLIFHKDFYYLQRFKDEDPDSQNIRIKSLFSYLNINARKITSFDLKAEKVSIENINMDYSEIEKQINNMRVKSITYLRTSLSLQ